MADEPLKPKPELTDRAREAKSERDARLAGTLRDNLRRRKPPERKLSERPGVKNGDRKDQPSDG